MASRTDDRIVVRIDAELLDLVLAYLANRSRDAESIKAALQRQDFETIHRIGHNLQGSGRTFGFEDLTAIGAALQGAVAAADSAEILRLRDRLRNFVSRIELKAARTQNAHAITQAEAATMDSARCGEGSPLYEPCVLVVDDQEMNRVIVSRYLERAGYAVRQVASGDEALAALEQGPRPVVVLLDVLMSGMNGFEVCRRIKANPETRAIPVVMVTGFGAEAGRVRGTEAGADGFLSKPVDREELLAQVCALTHRKTTSGTLRQLSGSL